MNERLDPEMYKLAMDRLAKMHANTAAPFEIERVLLAEFDRVRRRRRTVSWTIQAVAAAAAVIIVLAMPWRHEQPTPAVPEAASVTAMDSEQPYTPIPYVAPLAPYERAEIIRMALPVAALIAAGLPVRTTDPGARVEADVLVGQDGRARAFRLVSQSSN